MEQNTAPALELGKLMYLWKKRSAVILRSDLRGKLDPEKKCETEGEEVTLKLFPANWSLAQ